MKKLQMNEDERIRAYLQRVIEVVVGIKNCGGTSDEEEVIAKILKSLTPAYKFKSMCSTLPLVRFYKCYDYFTMIDYMLGNH